MRRIQMSLMAVMMVLSCCASLARATDPDSDADGLSDFHEVHKHFTDPKNADSDGDGTPDGDWLERREYAYTVHAVLQVMPPITEGVLAGDDQDARILLRGDGWVMLEVVLYPFNTAGEAIESDDGWRESVRDLDAFIRPGPTTNWDPEMRRDMIQSLEAERGIDAASAADKELVEKASAWLLARVDHLNSSSYGIQFKDGLPSVIESEVEAFRRIMHDPNGTIDDQFQREVYGKGMYESRLTGSCTSAANYLTTGLRALGIPTRMVRAIPLVDASDPAQIEMALAGISNHQVKVGLRSALEDLGQSFAGHTYNDVFVGGRWRRLNYTSLGQGCYDPGGFGFLIVIHRYNDLAEAGIADTWGRWLTREKAPPFLGSNPYRAISVHDQFGAHCEMKNPSPDDDPSQTPRREHAQLTFTRFYWANGADAPQFIRDQGFDRTCFLGHVQEWFPEERDGAQLKRFTARADNRFLLKAEGHPDLRAEALVGSVSDPEGGFREILLQVHEDDFAQMAPGIAYTLHPANDAQVTWKIDPGATLTRDD